SEARRDEPSPPARPRRADAVARGAARRHRAPRPRPRVRRAADPARHPLRLQGPRRLPPRLRRRRPRHLRRRRPRPRRRRHRTRPPRRPRLPRDRRPRRALGRPRRRPRSRPPNAHARRRARRRHPPLAARRAPPASRGTALRVEPWAVPAADLAVGRRPPRLVDALDDGIPLWPPGAPPIRLAFTPADAVFCAGCLIDWVDAGGAIARRALAEGRRADAAIRIRDDITRMATAALLLDGDTRHRRAGSLHRFARRWIATGLVSSYVLPA